MESGVATDFDGFGRVTKSFTEIEVSVILDAIFATINIPFKKSEDVPKSILIDFFGTQKAGKTKTTEKVEQVFRRHGYKAFCPPETAEIEEVRSALTNNQVVNQAIHLTGVQDRVLSMANHPRVHVGMISRGLIDMDYWYERGLRKGVYSPLHVQSVRNQIYEYLRMNLVDAFFFFTCSVKEAMKREYEDALTQKRGSKMNEKEVAETIAIYEYVLAGVNENVPGLPICHIDTSDLSVKQVGEKVLDFLLPTVCTRFTVPEYRFMPYAISLVQRQAHRSANFEEQIKFSGHPSCKRLEKEGWVFTKESHQEDTYLYVNQEGVRLDPLAEGFRIRKENGEIKFMYKGAQHDSMLSHRRPCTFAVSPDEAAKILATYQTAAVLKKRRRHLRKDGVAGDGHFFSLHLDKIEGLGNFTEIRARGSSEKTHTAELLKLGEALGFGPSTMMEGNYLSIALNKATP